MILCVPEGFCITTEVYKKIVCDNSEFNSVNDQLSFLKIIDKRKISEFSKKVREIIEQIPIPMEIIEEVLHYISKLGEKNAYAVRSSATAEDLPLASFAGQQDIYLNIKGMNNILKYVKKCWASLYTDRAVIYRIQNNFDHRKVYLSVVIQKMVFSQASGIMFTADPVTFNRKVTSIDASFGLGEALVSGLVNPDIYKVREGKILYKKISIKKLAVSALQNGGTKGKDIDTAKQNIQTLRDEQILQLTNIGRKIENYFGCPQDIEWCLCEGKFYIVQSRPITTLYPVPSEAVDGKNHVYISFGHRQMMTEAMRPLGISLFQTLFKQMVGTPMNEMGGRLYIDVSRELSSPFIRMSFFKGMDAVDVLMKNALADLVKRKNFIKTLYRKKTAMASKSMWLKWILFTLKDYRANNPAILSNIKAFGPGAHSMKFEQNLIEAKQKKHEIINRLERLHGGKGKARKFKKAVSVLRNYAGYREFNKYVLVWYDWIIKQTFMKEADALVHKGIIQEREDIYYLTFEEFRKVVEAHEIDYNIISKRKKDYKTFQKLTPPRVITSEGEIITGQYNRDKIPKGAMAGVPVSSGSVEGRARVILRMEDADIEEGDILVTKFTDPSWTPLFVSIKGLITEVGGMMTHGAVVAREYGLPAVVGVENATKLIKDGQRIRLNGEEGYVEIL
ncbi:hypothetical protein CLOSBL3_12193 [Clostridiaceae bacterium BL-3]|nr:hypothetical protein CLOSBL3_12193 [Clostridiaceae bacterium BL-3]